MLKKFEKTDIFINKIKTYPKVKIFTYSGNVYYNNDTTPIDGVRLFDFLIEPGTQPSLTLSTENEQYLTTEDENLITID